MKFVALLALSLSVFAVQQVSAKEPVKQTKHKDKDVSWVTDIEKAKVLSKKSGAPLFLYFSGSDWCPHCKKLDLEVLSKSQFQSALKGKVIFVHLDFPRHSEQDLKTKEQNSKLKK